MFLFGVSYAVVSLGCTWDSSLPAFRVCSALVVSSTGFGLCRLWAGHGRGHHDPDDRPRPCPHIDSDKHAQDPAVECNRISGVLLGLSGAYLIIYGWWEIQVLRGNISTNRLVSFFEDMQVNVNIWIDETGPTRLGVGLLLMVGAALMRGLWSELVADEPGNRSGLASAWVGCSPSSCGRKPTCSSCRFFVPSSISPNGLVTGSPTRFGGAFLGELVVIAIVGWTLWFRMRSRDR